MGDSRIYSTGLAQGGNPMHPAQSSTLPAQEARHGHFKKKVKSWAGMIAGRTGVLERSLSSKLTIVAFHRVNSLLAADPLTCSPAAFANFLRYFKIHFKVIPLKEQ